MSAGPPSESGLRLEADALRLLLADHPDGIMVIDDTGTIQVANPAAATILGRPVERLVGLHFGVPLVGVEPVEIDIPIDGEPAGTCELRVSKSSWGGGTAHLVGLRDVSDRKRLQLEAERARLEAEAAAEAKTAFLSRVSHELRTPMTTIMGYADLLSAAPLSAPHDAWVRAIVAASDHLLRVINDLLDLARVEQGHMRVTLEPVDLASTLAQVLTMVGPMAAQRGITLTPLAPGSAELAVRADRQRLVQVLLNLCANAVKYNRDAGSVGLSARLVDGGRVRIEVSDTGPGLSKTDEARIFIPFERLGADRTAEGGSGLGLALSKALVDEMGGILGVETAVGAGSVFWVELPAALAVRALATPARRPPVSARRYAMPRTLLVVEDRLEQVELLREVLVRRPSVSLRAVASGELAVDAARELRADAVLLDVHLAGIDGAEVVRRLRADDETAALPVILMSADGDERREQRMRELDAVAHLAKPLDVGALVAVLDGLLDSDAP